MFLFNDSLERLLHITNEFSKKNYSIASLIVHISKLLTANVKNDVRILTNGTAYQTDAGMCGDYDSVIGMNKGNSLNRFLKKDSIKHFPADGNATLCGLIVECNTSSGLANRVETFIYGGELINNN